MKKLFFLSIMVFFTHYTSIFSYQNRLFHDAIFFNVIMKWCKGGSLFASTASSNGQNENQQKPVEQPAESSLSSRPVTIQEIELFRRGNWGFLFTALHDDRTQLWEHIFKMIASGLSINVRDESGKTLLFYITKDDLPYISKLIQGGIDVHARDNYGKTAFDCFCDRLFSQSYTVSQFAYMEKFVDAAVTVSDQHAKKIFQIAIQNDKMRLAEKVNKIYNISKEFKSDLLFELEDKDCFEKLLRFDVDILRKNSKKETIIDVFVRNYNFSHLEILLKKYPDQIITQQKTKMIQAALDKNKVSFIMMMSKEHLNAFTQTQIDQSVTKAVENGDHFTTKALIDGIGDKISKDSAQKVFKELILKNSLTLAKKIDSFHTISKEYKSSILFDVKKPEQLVVLLNFDIDLQCKNSKRQNVIDFWVANKNSLLLKELFKHHEESFNNQQITGTIQIALEEKDISFSKMIYKNHLNKFTEQQMSQFIELELEAKDIEFLQTLRENHPNSFSANQTAELENLIIEKKIADAERAQRNKMIKWGAVATVVAGAFVYWLFNRNK